MGPAAFETVWRLANAGVAARCLQLAVQLGVPDLIGPGAPATAADLAPRCGAEPGALDRVLRLLTAYGVFARVDGGYAHTEASLLLRADHQASMRPTVELSALDVWLDSLRRLDHSVRTGRPAAEAVTAGGLWAHLAADPEAGRVFDAAMTAKALADIPAVVAAVDWGRFRTVADVGGGRGHLLRAVLEAYPAVHGLLVDLPGVLAAAPPAPDRMRLHPADFFADPLPEADGYVLMEVIHDWTDAESAAILAAVRRAARPGARVLVVENLLAEDAPDLRGWNLDVLMLALTGGRERTGSELAALLDAAGFGDATVVPTGGRLKVVEATAR